MRTHLKAPSPAMLVACLALFVALTGTSIAAVSLAKNSVGNKQLKKNAVTGAKIKSNTVTGSDIKESSLGTVPGAAIAATAAKASSADAVAADSITSASVKDRSLTAADTLRYSGTVTVDPVNLAADSCEYAVVDIGVNEYLGDDLIVLSAPVNWNYYFSIYAQSTNLTDGKFRVVYCNGYNSPLNPDTAQIRYGIFKL